MVNTILLPLDPSGKKKDTAQIGNAFAIQKGRLVQTLKVRELGLRDLDG